MIHRLTDEELAQVKADAWDAGAQAQAAAYGMDQDTGPNPYRQEATR